MHSGIEYYITLEGIDENGDLNVYCAEVLIVSYKQEEELIKFQLVNESFTYPFEELRYLFWVVLKTIVNINNSGSSLFFFP